jgi:nicotinate-nucleotide pyrophosphorylase (carboxylating)
MGHSQGVRVEPNFDAFFSGRAKMFLKWAVETALSEDGPDLTSMLLFKEEDMACGRIVAKQDCVLAGLPLVTVVLSTLAPGGGFEVVPHAVEGERLDPGREVVRIAAPARTLLAAERIILNFMCHLSGVATLTRTYVDAMGETTTRLLDTRKTLPGLRHLEKYAVVVGGGANHRFGLSDMLMLKDNHIDRAGGIAPAVANLRRTGRTLPPLEVECRTLEDVVEAVEVGVDRIMLDNMDEATMAEALAVVPDGVETEISGSVSLETIGSLARLGATYISVGRLTHSAPSADLSLQFTDDAL